MNGGPYSFNAWHTVMCELCERRDVLRAIRDKHIPSQLDDKPWEAKQRITRRIADIEIAIGALRLTWTDATSDSAEKGRLG